MIIFDRLLSKHKTTNYLFIIVPLTMIPAIAEVITLEDKKRNPITVERMSDSKEFAISLGSLNEKPKAILKKPSKNSPQAYRELEITAVIGKRDNNRSSYKDIVYKKDTVLNKSMKITKN